MSRVFAVVHIAAEPEGQVQRCARCGCILIDARGAMTVGGGDVGCWQPGGYVEVTEGNPTQSLAVQADANGFDTIPCDRKVQ